MYRILIVEDDLIIAQTVQKHLCQWGFEAKYTENFQTILEEFITYEPQLVLLDISLPFYNGFHWCTQIRNHSKVPIIFLSSANDNMNVVMAMNLGGDDFISKPFDLNILVAKMQALLRRTYTFHNELHLLEHKGVILNLADASLTYNGQKIDLTKNEFRILQLLMENTEKTVSRDRIIAHLWEGESFIDDNTLTVNMTRLRKKLEDYRLNNFITTKKGMGYIIT